jgi:hypothetical protein
MLGRRLAPIYRGSRNFLSPPDYFRWARYYTEKEVRPIVACATTQYHRFAYATTSKKLIRRKATN